MALVTFEDVTELEASRRRSALLAEASAQLGRSLDPHEVAVSVAQLTVPAFADWGFVELLQPDGELLREGMAMADPSKREIAEEYIRLYPLDMDSPVGSPQVIRSGEPQLIPELPPDFVELAAPEPRQRAVLEGIGFTSIMIVPLRARGRVIGDLALAMAESGRRFGEDDLTIAQQLADRCALALDNARLYSELAEAVESTRRAGEEVNTILGGIADAVTAQAPDGTLVYANEATVRMVGMESVEALLAAPPGEVAGRFEMTGEDGGPLPIDRLPGRRALRGEHPEPLVVRSRMAGTREWRWTRVKATPVFEPDGAVRLAINVIEDITELKRAEQGQRFLAEAGRVLAGSLDYQETLAAVARLAVPDIADWCAVDVLADGEVKRVATTHADPRKVAEVLEIAERYPPDPASGTGVYAVMRSGRSESWGEITDEMLQGAARDEGHLALLRSIGMTSAMVVPMRRARLGGRRDHVRERRDRPRVRRSRPLARGEPRLARGDRDRELPPVCRPLGDRAHAAGVAAAPGAARRAGLLARRGLPLRERGHRGRRRLLRRLQHRRGPVVRGRRRRLRQGRRGGRGDRHGALHDPCGRGEAALARGDPAAAERGDAARGLARPGRALLHDRLPAPRPLAHARARDRRLRRPSAAGRCCAPTARSRSSAPPGTLIGLVERPELHDRAGDLHAGDTIVLYTDGLTEAGAPATLWGPEELAQVLRGAAGGTPQDVVDHALREALGAAPAPRDDIAVVALRALAG